MTSITRTRLRCNEKDCPRRDDEDFHKPVCYAIPDLPHSDEAQHQHHPKRSQGGKTVVAVICSYCHDRIDNGHWGNAVEFGVYRIWDVHGNTLLRVSTAEGEAEGRIAPRAAVLPSAADVRGPGTGEEDSLAASADDSNSSPVPGASSATDEAAPSGTGEKPGSPSSVAPGAGADSQGRSTLPVPNPMTRSSVGEAGGQEVGTLPTPAPISESLKPNGLDLPAEFTFEEWTDLAGMVAGMNKNRQWWAGDLVLAGERFGERATNFWNDLGYRWESLSNAVRVCRRFPLQSGLRRPDFSFAHHAVVCALTDTEVREWFLKAAADDWTVKQLREQVHGVKPKTVHYALSELREALAAWPGEPKVRNNARRWAEAWLNHLEAR